MDDTPHTNGNADVIVVGAGLAGLAAAATAARAGRQVLVLDGRSPGGRARTDERGGFLFNQGAHALYAGGHADRVLGDLGIAIPPGGKPSTDTYGRRGDVVSPLPFTPTRVLRSKLVSTAGKAQMGKFVLSLRSLDPAPLADRSAEAWLAGLGLRDDATDVLRLLSRVASYADDLDAISADAVAGQLKGAVSSGVRYLDGGWQVLVAALQAVVAAAGGRVRTGDPVVAVEAVDGGATATLGDGTAFTAPAVVLATGGPAATASLLREPPRWGLVGPPATAACLDLGLRRAPERTVLFGVDRPLYLSTHTPAADMAPSGSHVVHLMRYGARNADLDRAELWEHARVAGVQDDDVVEQRFLARMVTNHAVPVPGSGLAGRPSIAAAGIPGVYLAGEWVGPDGLLADAALASGQAAGLAAVGRATRAGVPA
jgi:phytoene dehydrogenase-like protein